MSKQLFIILILLPFITKSQVVSDAKSWTGISLSKKIKNFEFVLTEELRRNENFTHTDKVFTELGIEYDVKKIKGLSIFTDYRFSRENEYETKNYDINHRIDFGLDYKYKLDKIQFSIKTKIQTESASPEKNNPTYNRNKLTVKYKFDNPFTPYLSYEFYYQFNEERIINRTRLSLGTKFDLNKKNALKAFYLYENKFNVKNLQHNHIWGVSYTLEI